MPVTDLPSWPGVVGAPGDRDRLQILVDDALSSSDPEVCAFGDFLAQRLARGPWCAGGELVAPSQARVDRWFVPIPHWLNYVTPDYLVEFGGLPNTISIRTWEADAGLEGEKLEWFLKNLPLKRARLLDKQLKDAVLLNLRDSGFFQKGDSIQIQSSPFPKRMVDCIDQLKGMRSLTLRRTWNFSTATYFAESSQLRALNELGLDELQLGDWAQLVSILEPAASLRRLRLADLRGDFKGNRIVLPPTLEELELAGPWAEPVMVPFFRALPQSLRTLRIRRCRIARKAVLQLPELPNLATLDLQSTETIEELPLARLPSLLNLEARPLSTELLRSLPGALGHLKTIRLG